MQGFFLKKVHANVIEGQLFVRSLHIDIRVANRNAGAGCWGGRVG